MSYDEYGSTPEDRLADFGVPSDAIKEMIQQQGTQQINSASRAQAAIQRANQDPYFRQHAGDMGAYLQHNPELAASVARIGNEDADAALALLKLKYMNDTGPNPRQLAAQNMDDYEKGTKYLPLGGPEQQQRRQDPTESPNYVPHPVWSQPDNVQQAWNRYQKTGGRQDAVAYAKARLRNVISDEFLNQ